MASRPLRIETESETAGGTPTSAKSPTMLASRNPHPPMDKGTVRTRITSGESTITSVKPISTCSGRNSKKIVSALHRVASAGAHGAHVLPAGGNVNQHCKRYPEYHTDDQQGHAP